MPWQILRSQHFDANLTKKQSSFLLSVTAFKVNNEPMRAPGETIPPKLIGRCQLADAAEAADPEERAGQAAERPV